MKNLKQFYVEWLGIWGDLKFTKMMLSKFWPIPHFRFKYFQNRLTWSVHICRKSLRSNSQCPTQQLPWLILSLMAPGGSRLLFLKMLRTGPGLCRLKDSYSKKHQDNWMQVRWSFVQPIVIQSEIAQGGKIILKLIGFTFSTESSRSLSWTDQICEKMQIKVRQETSILSAVIIDKQCSVDHGTECQYLISDTLMLHIIMSIAVRRKV